MDALKKLIDFVEKIFKTTLEIFYEALRLSPNAQGYISGSISELLLKKDIEEKYYCEISRIREKWEGKKHPNHHGDFYFRFKGNKEWYVIESKGVKSNSEKWHKLYNYENLLSFLFTHRKKIKWIKNHENAEQEIISWINSNLSKFNNEYKDNIYDYEEIKKYLHNKPKRETDKSKSIEKLKKYTREEIGKMIDERLAYIMDKVKILETHFVSGKSGVSERTQATPRKDEFNIISIDIFLRYTEHKFLFANPQLLDSSGDDPNHLQQNYIMGFVFGDFLNLTDEWYDNLNEVYKTLNKKDAVKETDMQIDNRILVAEENID